MGRSQRLVLAVVGLVGLVAWYAYARIYDARLIHRLRLQEGAIFAPSGVWSALRFGLPVIAVVLASIALLQTIRDRPVRGWSLAVVVVLLGPLVITRGLPLRWVNLPYYLLSALYLVLTLSAWPRTEQGHESSFSGS